jgi:multicomponent Na+:H+ antiporter subunit G
MLWDALTLICLVAGSFFSIVGGMGLVRMPDFFSRMNAGGLTDTMGAGLILLGLMFQAGLSLALSKLVMILVLLWVTSPTVCHALAQAAIAQGLEPPGRVAGGDSGDSGMSEPDEPSG